MIFKKMIWKILKFAIQDKELVDRVISVELISGGPEKSLGVQRAII